MICELKISSPSLPPPQFWQDGGLFIQTLWRPAAKVVQPPEEITGTKWAPSGHQVAILEKCREDTALTDLMAIAGRTDRTKFRHQVLNPLLEEGFIEMTIPDKPRSSQQKYRLTAKGKAWLKVNVEEKDA